jgi:hypothetical protein
MAAMCLNTMPSSYHSHAKKVVRGFTERRIDFKIGGP